jgi:hypothetical protein
LEVLSYARLVILPRYYRALSERRTEKLISYAFDLLFLDG